MALNILLLCAAYVSPPNVDHLFRYWLLLVKSEAKHITGPFVEGGSEWSSGEAEPGGNRGWTTWLLSEQ